MKSELYEELVKTAAPAWLKNLYPKAKSRMSNEEVLSLAKERGKGRGGKARKENILKSLSNAPAEELPTSNIRGQFTQHEYTPSIPQESSTKLKTLAKKVNPARVRLNDPNAIKAQENWKAEQKSIASNYGGSKERREALLANKTNVHPVVPKLPQNKASDTQQSKDSIAGKITKTLLGATGAARSNQRIVETLKHERAVKPVDRNPFNFENNYDSSNKLHQRKPRDTRPAWMSQFYR